VHVYIQRINYMYLKKIVWEINLKDGYRCSNVMTMN